MFVVFVSTWYCHFTYFISFANILKIPFRIFHAGLSDPARLLTNQIVCFTVVII